MTAKKAYQLLTQPAQITEQYWEEDALPLVSISCVTYNHERFIRDTMEGFLTQKTTFPIEILVHDDASTDRTSVIIREYQSEFPNLIFPIVQVENQYSKGVRGMSRTYNYPRARGKYIALCEGDDHWTDPFKLQRQVDFLEANPEYAAVAENGMVKNFTWGQTYLFSEEPERDLTIQEMVEKRRFPTASVVFRKAAIHDFWKDTKQGIDTILWCYLASKGKFRYLTNISSVYNRGTHGMVESTDKFEWAKKVEAWNIELVRLFAENYFDRQIAYDTIWKHYWSVYSQRKRRNIKQWFFLLYKCLKYNFHLTFRELIRIHVSRVRRKFSASRN
jgi:glycosyltransferase involved in cell wall biosynthesis